MTVLRVVPIATVDDLAAASAFYVDILGMREVMNHGWIATFTGVAGTQLSLMTRDATASCNPAISIEVDDVDVAYDLAVVHGLDIVHPLTDEPWGVRRFFVRNAAGTVVNILAHR